MQHVSLKETASVDRRLVREIVRFVQILRREELERKPGIAETLDWASSLIGLDVRSIHGDSAAAAIPGEPDLPPEDEGGFEIHAA